MIQYFEICILFLCITVLASTFKGKLKYFYLIFASLFFTAQLVSIYIFKNTINIDFYQNINVDNINNFKKFFIYEYFLIAIVFLGTFLSAYYLSKKFSINKIKIIFVLSLLITTLFFTGSLLQNIYQLANILIKKDVAFQSLLTDLGIPANAFIDKSDVHAQPGKNIIVISLESLESGLLGRSLSESKTPNLKNLSNKWSFLESSQVPGGGWTLASMYITQTGFPFVIPGTGSEAFDGIRSIKTATLGDVLKAAGYKNLYLMGNSKFERTENFLKAIGYDVVSDDNYIGKYPIKDYGIDDQDIFAEAQLQVEKLSKDKNQRFALFINTINTHFPNGFVDARMESILRRSDYKTDLDFTAASLDYRKD